MKNQNKVKKFMKNMLKKGAIIIGYVIALNVAQQLYVFAADDPLTVINNLSDFIFGLIRAVGMIILGFGVWSSTSWYEFKITRSNTKGKWNNDISRRDCNYIF